MITCLLLAAGLSSRFGSPKALAKVQGQTLLTRQIQMLLSAGIEQIVVVLGAHAELLEPLIKADPRIKIITNEHYQQGQTSSVKAGVQLISEDENIIVLPVDFPFVLPKTVLQLTEYFKTKAPKILIPTYNGRKGHPPIFSKKLRDEILQLDNSLGLNEIIRRHERDVQLLPVDDKGVLATFNTPEEFAQILADFI